MSKVLEYYKDNNPFSNDPDGDDLNAFGGDPEPTKLDYLDVSVGEMSIYFEFNGILTEDEAFELQKEYGKHPHGYGFYGYTVEDGVTTWNCSRSCD